MSKSYHNQLKINSGNVWFKNFKPDVEIKGSNEESLSIKWLIENAGVPDCAGIVKDLSFDPLMKKFLNADVYFTDTSSSFFLDPFEDEKKKYKSDYKNTYGSSIQINFDNDISFIIFHCENCCNQQLAYEYNHIKANIDKTIPFENFEQEHHKYVKSKLDECMRSEGITVPSEINIEEFFSPTVKKRTKRAECKEKETEFFNQIKTNPNDYFWFYNFEPDTDIKGSKKLFTAMRRLTMETTLGISKDTTFSLLETKMPKTTVFFVDVAHRIGYVEYMKNEYNINIDNNIYSLQISFDSGDKFIFVVGEYCYPFVQAIRDFKHYQANKEKYTSYESFLYKYGHHVCQELLEYMKKGY